jgi:hypothetical protein
MTNPGLFLIIYSLNIFLLFTDTMTIQIATLFLTSFLFTHTLFTNPNLV